MVHFVMFSKFHRDFIFVKGVGKVRGDAKKVRFEENSEFISRIPVPFF